MDIVSFFPTTCRTCEKKFDGNDGVYFIPSLNQWFVLEKVQTAKRQFNPSKLLFYCNKCYINKSLKQQNSFCCVNCQVYDNSIGAAPQIKKDKVLIYGSMEMENFEFILPLSELPSHLQQDGQLCKECLNKLMNEGVIKKEENNNKLVENNDTNTNCYLCKKQWDTNDKEEFPHGTAIFCWATFSNPTMFTYWQRYRLKDGEINSTKFPVQICNCCLKKMTYESDPIIECDNCHKLYEDICGTYDCQDVFGTSDWGRDCAAYISETGISCGYGSKYDDETFQWSCGIMPDKYKNMKLMCDECIDNLIKDDVIRSLC